LVFSDWPVIMRLAVFLRVCSSAGLALALAAPAWAGPAPAPVHIGEAEVREAAFGMPCFTIGEREEKRSGARSFQAIAVTDISRKAPVAMWSMAMPPERTFPLMFSMCVPYAGRTPSLPQQDAELLEPGKLYEVTIAVRPGDSPLQPRSYAARFCLARQPDGRNSVRMLAAGARSAAPCGAAEAPARAVHGKARAK
jgi:hypothetical protein